MVLSALSKFKRPNSLGVLMEKVMVFVMYDLNEDDDSFYSIVTFTSMGAVEAGFLP